MLTLILAVRLHVHGVPNTTNIAELDSHTNPKTLWFAWCSSGEATQIESFLAELAAQGPAAEAGASIDWHKQLKVRLVGTTCAACTRIPNSACFLCHQLGSPGDQVLDEFECALRLAEDAAYQADFSQ